jgi:hypothetical protein
MRFWRCTLDYTKPPGVVQTFQKSLPSLWEIPAPENVAEIGSDLRFSLENWAGTK